VEGLLPGVTLHFVLAQRTVAHWRVSGARAPFDIDDPAQLNAFHHGAIGPDIGYIPGGDRVISELAHCVRTGSLTRALVETAHTPVERAFAWGWVTHVIGDREIHPLIGRGVGELVHGSNDVFVDGSSDPESHLRIELGLDCWFAARHPDARAVRLRPTFDESTVGYLERAYARTYGVAIPKASFLHSHVHMGKRAGQFLATIGFIGALMDDARGLIALPSMRRMLRAAYHRSTLRGLSLAYLNPVSPAEWLVDGVVQSIPEHTAHVLELVERGLDDFEDWNLDTGRRLDAETDHLGTLHALESLGRLMEEARGRAAPASGPGANRTARSTPTMDEAA
jgi:hypothetical protein